MNSNSFLNFAFDAVTTAISFQASVFLCALAAGEKIRPLNVFTGVPDTTVEAEL